MIQTVVKRDGRIVGFNEEKIVAAIRKAMLRTDEGEDEHLVHQIADRIAMRGKPQMTVEEENRLLKKENSRLQMELEFLKKAAAYFAKESK